MASMSGVENARFSRSCSSIALAPTLKSMPITALAGMGLAPRAPPASKRLVLLLHRLGWNARPLYSACDAAMSCSPAAEDTWGPVVSRDCLGGFDFTLLCEEAISTLAPLAIAGT